MEDSKGVTQFSEGVAPKYLKKGKGAYVTDVDDNKYLDLHGAANKIISYLESNWEPHGSYGKYCQGVEQTEENQRYMFYQYTDFMDKVRGHSFFDTFFDILVKISKFN